MEDYRSTLKQAGKILIIVGAIDIAAMIACIFAGQSYSSSLNVFALAAGIFLFRELHRAALQLMRIIEVFHILFLHLVLLRDLLYDLLKVFDVGL